MLENIWIGNLHCAIVLRAGFSAEGIQFFTRDEDTLQLGYMRRDKGYSIKPHIHRSTPRQVTYTNEVLLIRKGRVRVNFYDEDQTFRKGLVLETGDIILLMQAGHGFEMLEDSEIVEVKQGPYVGETDKVRFEA